ncbi:DUF6159 family protein [Camelimonas abortus]|uniref:DUF6159 family protein n=1 Tax=Camelimonas abortus TaxID=1017184 RepID=A0ABV7LCV5_9HYPH
MTFAQRLRNSWAMLGACMEILRSDARLLLFPLMGFAAVILVALVFLGPLFWTLASGGAASDDGDSSLLFYVTLFVFYVAEYFVASFFAVALVATVMRRFAGEAADVAWGLAFAAGKWRQILGYAVIAATVGVLLRFISEKAGTLGSLAASLAGVAWSLVSLLIIPVLVSRDVSPIDAVKESAELFRRTWGESVVGAASIGVAFFVLHACVLVAGLFFAIALFVNGRAAAGAAVLALMAACWGLLAAMQGALSGIYSAALYRYATTGEGVGALDRNLLAHAFAPKGSA